MAPGEHRPYSDARYAKQASLAAHHAGVAAAAAAVCCGVLHRHVAEVHCARYQQYPELPQ